jgi:hypothetical protein
LLAKDMIVIVMVVVGRTWSIFWEDWLNIITISRSWKVDFACCCWPVSFPSVYLLSIFYLIIIHLSHSLLLFRATSSTGQAAITKHGVTSHKGKDYLVPPPDQTILSPKLNRTNTNKQQLYTHLNKSITSSGGSGGGGGGTFQHRVPQARSHHDDYIWKRLVWRYDVAHRRTNCYSPVISVA